MLSFTKLQKKVLQAVEARLKDEPWFLGISLDQMPKYDDEIAADFNGTVDTIICDTMYWDAPNHGLGD